ncbi:ATP-binding protein [Pleionea sp. CnH1-48]|uniref:ATP-binding protein n=1 Tax=Pleionea sp. CnH1-48 TaxID=2954494 RepID=UPI002096ED3E|nr:ATP-binding protein [Pleionea sp. CnH1-48]MCO7222743.1 ATP-binding protein [Pleionea sp. CnH1-48]
METPPRKYLKKLNDFHAGLLDRLNRSDSPMDERMLRRARVLTGLLIYSFLGSLLMAIVRVSSEGLIAGSLIAIIIAVVIFALIVAYYMIQDVFLIADITVIILLLLIFSMAWNDGGLLSRVNIWLPPIILFSNFVARRLKGAATLLLTLVGLTTIYIVQTKGIIETPASSTPLIGRLFAYMAACTFVALVTHAYEQTRRDVHRALLKAKKEAEELSSLKSEFLANMSHEIRTPMNGILGMVELVMNSELKKEQKKQLGLAYSSATSLLTILNDILDLSKIEAGKLELEHVEVALLDLFHEVSEILAYNLQDKPVELYLDTSGLKHNKVRTDPIRLRQICNNLIGNAIKFTEEGSIVITVSSEELSESAVKLTLSVADTGIGIEASQLPKLFDKFSQADSSVTRRFGGTGLGLVICEHLIHALGGDISVSSEYGSGSVFNVTLHAEKVIGSLPKLTNLESHRLALVTQNTYFHKTFEAYLKLIKADIIHYETIHSLGDLLDQNNSLDAIIIDGEETQNIFKEISELTKNIKQNPPQLIVLTHSVEQEKPQEDTLLIPKPLSHRSIASIVHYLTHKETSEGHVHKSGEHNEAPQNEESENISEQTSILVVEDNRVNQEVIKGLLKPLRCHIDIAGNGLEALNTLKNQKHIYQLILMDCQMPEMDGFETTKSIRSGEAGNAQKDIPIIALTASAMKGDKEKCFNVGMNGYLTKPINRERLMDLLHEHLSV